MKGNKGNLRRSLLVCGVTERWLKVVLFYKVGSRTLLALVEETNPPKAKEMIPFPIFNQSLSCIGRFSNDHEFLLHLPSFLGNGLDRELENKV